MFLRLTQLIIALDFLPAVFKVQPIKFAEPPMIKRGFLSLALLLSITTTPFVRANENETVIAAPEMVNQQPESDTITFTIQCKGEDDQVTQAITLEFKKGDDAQVWQSVLQLKERYVQLKNSDDSKEVVRQLVALIENYEAFKSDPKNLEGLTLLRQIVATIEDSSIPTRGFNLIMFEGSESPECGSQCAASTCAHCDSACA